MEFLGALDGGAHFFSGGLGGLGLLTARLLVERGARHLVLSSRSNPLAGLGLREPMTRRVGHSICYDG